MSETVQQLEMALIRRVVHGGSIDTKLRATITLQFKGNKHYLEWDFWKIISCLTCFVKINKYRDIFSVKTMNNKYYFHTKTLTSILQSDRHFDSQSTAQTQAQKQNVRGKSHYVNTEQKEGRTELQREYSGYYSGLHWNKKCWTLIHYCFMISLCFIQINFLISICLGSPWCLMQFVHPWNWWDGWKTKCLFQVKCLSLIILGDLVKVWVFAGSCALTTGDKKLGSTVLKVNKSVTETIATGNQHWGLNNLNIDRTPISQCISFASLVTKKNTAENQDWWIWTLWKAACLTAQTVFLVFY